MTHTLGSSQFINQRCLLRTRSINFRLLLRKIQVRGGALPAHEVFCAMRETRHSLVTWDRHVSNDLV